MLRHSLIVGLLCLLGASAAKAQPFVVQAIPDTALVQPGLGFRWNLNRVFEDSSRRHLTYAVRSSDDTKAIAFLSDSLVFVLPTTPTVGDTVRVTVTARNLSGAEASTAFTVEIDARPRIGTVVATPREPEAGEPLTLSVKITDNNGFPKAVILYKRGGIGTPRIDRLTLQDPPADSLYAITLPPDFVTDRGVEFAIVAADNRCFPDFIPTTGKPAFVTVASQGARRNTPQPPGAYRLISVPLDLEAKSPTTIFEDDLGEYDDTRWRFFEVSHRLGDDTFGFEELPTLVAQDRNMLPGKAFLLIVEDSDKRIDSGPGTSISTLEEFALDLVPGWNFVGNPFNFTIPIENLRLQSGAALTLQTFSDAWSDPVDAIEPFEGYATFNPRSEPDILFINPGVAAVDSLTLAQAAAALGCAPRPPVETKPAPPPREAAPAWAIRIVAESGAARDRDTRAVVAPHASATWDRLDQPEPPGFGEHVSVYFPHPEWQQHTARYRLDARPMPGEGAVWPFEVTATVRAPIQLSFEDLGTVPPRYAVWLVDDLLGRAQNLREKNTYTVAGSEQPRRLKLVVGTRPFADAERRAYQEAPARFALFPSFPNPFNPATTLRYSVPEAASVSLVIYDVRGRVVARLVSGEQAAGYHAVVWDGRSSAGVPVASGVYFARMQARRFAQTQTLVLAK